MAELCFALFRRWRVAGLACATALVCALATPAAAIDALVHAPVDCTNGSSCGLDVELSQASDIADKNAAKVADCLLSGLKLDRECRLQAVIDHNICDRQTGAFYSWAHLQDVDNAKSVMAKLTSTAESGEIVAAYRTIIVETDDAPAGEQHFAVCKVAVVGRSSGPPLSCTTVAIVSPAGTFLRVGKDPGGCTRSATPRADTNKIEINFTLKTKIGISSFADNLEKVLKENLHLTVNIESTDSDGELSHVQITAVAPPRESFILKDNFSENFDIELHLFLLGSRNIDVIASIHPMVCLTKSNELRTYHTPNTAQTAAYSEAFNKYIGEALSCTCPNHPDFSHKDMICQ